MVAVRFLRLVPRPRASAAPGRRYYRLVSYPHDAFQSLDWTTACEEAKRRRFAGVITPATGQIETFSPQAQACARWHNEGKDGYLVIF